MTLKSVNVALSSLVFLCSLLITAQHISAEASEQAVWQDGQSSVGIDSSKFGAIDELMDRYVDEKRVAGIVVSVSYDNELVYTKARGSRGLFDEKPMTEDALFRIYSMSKPIAAVALMQLYEQGEFDLNTPLKEVIPEFANLKVYNEAGEPTPPKQEITMLHLFTHTAGFGYVFGNHPVVQRIQSEQVLGSGTLDDMVQKISDIPLMFEPGTRWHYSLSSDIKGAAVERLSGMTFDKYLQKNIFEPLGMNDTFFSVPDEKLDRFLPNHSWMRGQDRMVQLPEDRANDGYRNTTFFSGGGGLVSTTHDYMTFARAVANYGELNGVRIIKPETVDLMRRNHLDDAIEAQGGTGENPEASRAFGGFGFGLGFGVNTGPSTAERSHGEYNWGGAAGTVFWIDPLEGLVVVGMIQLLASPHPLANDLHSAVRGALIYEKAVIDS